MRTNPLQPPVPLVVVSGPVGQQLSQRVDEIRDVAGLLENLLREEDQRADGPRAAARLLDCLRRLGEATRDAQRLAAYQVIELDYLTWRDAARALGTSTPTLARWRADITAERYRVAYPDGPPVDPLTSAEAGEAAVD